jgi:hypothetical protein
MLELVITFIGLAFFWRFCPIITLSFGVPIADIVLLYPWFLKFSAFG